MSWIIKLKREVTIKMDQENQIIKRINDRLRMSILLRCNEFPDSLRWAARLSRCSANGSMAAAHVAGRLEAVASENGCSHFRFTICSHSRSHSYMLNSIRTYTLLFTCTCKFILVYDVRVYIVHEHLFSA